MSSIQNFTPFLLQTQQPEKLSEAVNRKIRSSFLSFLILLVSLFCFPPSAKSQINLVKDILTFTHGSDPRGFINITLNGTIYFVANDGPHGVELWKTGGTATGTELVKDINQGAGGSIASRLFAFNGAIYFFANDGVNGVALWKSDGTESGTLLIKNLSLGIYSAGFTVFNGALYFSAADATHGVELWRSDGTVAGTVMVKDIYPGTNGSLAWGYYEMNGNLYFTATDNLSGSELWKTDGTAAGTILVKDIQPGANSSEPKRFIFFNNALYFFVSNAALWKTDGTTAGTVAVKNIAYGIDPGVLAVFNGALYFSGTNANGTELWKSDGTTAGTFMLKDITQGEESSFPQRFTVLNGLLLFTAIDLIYGAELWKTDGTTAGTVIVKDIYPGAYWDYDPPVPVLVPYNSSPSSLVNYNGAIYFNATDGTNGSRLWKTDGTEAGTLLIQDSIPGPAGSIPYSPANLTVVNGLLYFQASNGPDGIEIWKSDGTAAGSAMIKNIHIYTGNSFPTDLTAVNEKVFYRTNYGYVGYELWISDGTEAGTYLVKDIYPGPGSSSLTNLTKFNNKLIFSANDGVHNKEIWISDGTEPGTFILKDIYPGSLGSSPRSFSTIGNILFFYASDGTNGYELWKTDGTSAGTVLVKDIRPGSASSVGSTVVNSGGVNYFIADDGISGYELWKTDGTSIGTIMVKNINTGGSSALKFLTDVNGTLFFVANSDATGYELWKSDGTAAGTVQVKDFGGSNEVGALTNANGMIYFPVSGLLWRSDGTTAGTVIQTSNGNVCNMPFEDQIFFNLNGTIFFIGQNAQGKELWKSDGTDTGTFMVKDINTELEGSYINSFIEINGLAYFNALDNAHGRELWRSDGTTAGTFMVQDKYPGVDHFYTGPNAKTSSKLFISGTHYTVGSELFALCINPVGPCFSNGSVTQFIEENKDFTVNACEIIARLVPSGAKPVTGLTTAKVWKETTVPAVNGQPYVARHYEITPDYNPAGLTGRVTLFFTQQEFTDFNNHPASALDLPANGGDVIGKDNLRITKYPGVSNNGSGFPNSYTGTPVLINPVDSNIVWNIVDSRWEVSFDVTGFSGFIVQTSGTALPVKLLFFKGKLNVDKTVALQWKVEEQLGIADYVVERSNDGNNFSAIGNITANQYNSYTYQFTDLQVLKGKAFYRLRIIEGTGSFKYSDIVYLSTKDNSVLTVFPNPAKDIITVQLNSNQQKVAIKIVDEQGRLMLSEMIVANRINTIDISRLATGYYILEAIDKDQVTRTTFFKK